MGSLDLPLLIRGLPGGVIGIRHLIRPLVVVGALADTLSRGALLLLCLNGLLNTLLLPASVLLVGHYTPSEVATG